MENATQIALKKLEEVKIDIVGCTVVSLSNAKKIVEQMEIDILNEQSIKELKENKDY